jgi:hypothetical protein
MATTSAIGFLPLVVRHPIARLHKRNGFSRKALDPVRQRLVWPRMWNPQLKGEGGDDHERDNQQ